MAEIIQFLGINWPTMLVSSFGGACPMIHDLITRQKSQQENKIPLNREFFMIKGILMPFLAVVVNILLTHDGSNPGWMEALYIGASTPILIEKAVHASVPSSVSLEGGQ